MGGNNLLIKTGNRPALLIPGVEKVPVRPGHETIPLRHYSRKRIALAFGAAAISDFLAMWTDFLPPVQWALDLGTAAALFLILGRRWALLPGLLVEAIPGMGVFPVWILVVVSLVLYDEIKTHKS